MAKVLSVRVDDDLAKWADDYASQRGVKRGQVLEGALREFRELAARGMPDLPEAKSVGRPKSEEPVPEPTPIAAKRFRDMTPEEHLAERDRLRAIAAGHAAREKAERERKYAERGW